MMTKICSKCKKEQPIDQFYVRTDASNGRRASHCKSCKHARYLERMTDESYRRKYIANSRKWQKENPLRTKYLIAKSNALNDNRRRTINFDLTFKQCLDLWNKGCHYCGESLIDKTGSSLDRRDNDLGYSEVNILPCCGNCNKVRNTVLTVEETEVAIKAVLEYRRSSVSI